MTCHLIWCDSSGSDGSAQGRKELAVEDEEGGSLTLFGSPLGRALPLSPGATLPGDEEVGVA